MKNSSPGFNYEENSSFNNRKEKFFISKLTFRVLIEDFFKTIFRFPLPFFFIIGLAILFFLSINLNKVNIENQLWLFFGLGVTLSIAVSLFSENFSSRKGRFLLNLIGIVMFGLYVIFMSKEFLPIHYYQIFVLGIAFTFAWFVVSFFYKNADNAFWEFGKITLIQLFTSIIFALVLMLGLSLAVLSLRELFNIDISEKMYANLALACFGVFLPLYFLSTIPSEADKRKNKYHYNKFLKVLGIYVFFPILTIYTIIVYVYFFKITFTWELPNGWVTWLISILALVGFLTMIVQYPLRVEKNRMADLFARYFPILLLPLLVLMAVGISRRFTDYGFTIHRALVFLLNIWLFGISIYLFISQSRHLKWILISFSCIAFLSVVGPWSVISITKYSIQHDVIRLLTKNQYIIDDRIVDKKRVAKIKINDQDNTFLISKIEYLIDNFGVEAIQPLFEDDFLGKDKNDVFERLALNYQYQSENNDSPYFYATLEDENVSLHISDYTHFINVSIRDNSFVYNDSLYNIQFVGKGLKIKNNKSTAWDVSIDFNKKIKDLKKSATEKYLLPEMTIQDTYYTFIILNMVVQSKNDKPLFINQLNGYLFLK